MALYTQKKNVKGAKEIKFSGLKTTPSQPTDEQLAKINQFTRRTFKADELYVGQLRLANNCIDRDVERFSEEVLQRFAATAIRKTMLFDHNRQMQISAIGKFFDVEVEKLALQQAISETGEDLVLPEGITDVWFLSPWFYIPVKGVSEEVIVKIDAAIYDFASIGFRAESLVPVMDKEGAVLFWEYRGTGINTEMREGSLVYLGSQFGMSVKGDDKPERSKNNEIEEQEKGGSEMTEKEFLALCRKIFKTKSIAIESLEDDVTAALGNMIEAEKKTAAAEAAKPLNEKIKTLETDIEGLTPLAADGKAFRDGLISDYVSLKAKLGEVGETPEAQDPVKKVAAGYPIDFLKSEVDSLQKRVEKEFPGEKQLGGDTRTDKSGDLTGKDGEKNPFDTDEE